MKPSRAQLNPRVRLSILSLLVAIAAGLTLSTLAQEAPSAVASTPAPEPALSAPVADVLRMVDAKVDPTVILSFIKNSPVSYSLSASEVIALKERGVSDQVLTALLQHGAELRAQQEAQMAQAANAAPAATAPAPDYTYQASSPAPDYSYTTSDYPYAPENYSSYGYPNAYAYNYPYGYPYAYPYNYAYGWYNYGYPGPYYSGFFFGNDHFRHYRDFDDHRGGFHVHGAFPNHFAQPAAPHGTFQGTVGTGFHGTVGSVGFRSAPTAGVGGGFHGAMGGHATGGGHR